MKKLVFFIGGLKFGGMERVVLIAAELLKEQYDVTIVTLYQTNAEFAINNKTYDLNVPPRSGKINYFLVAIRRLIATYVMKRKLKPDIVFSFGMYSNYLNALTKRNEKIVMGIRAHDWFTKPFLNKRIDRFIVSKFDSVNSVSKLISDDAEFYWGIPSNRNRVIYNPYDVEFICEKSNEEPSDFLFMKDKFYYISMGRLTSQKAFNHLIKAFKIVHDRNPDTNLIILGNGEFKEQLTELARQLNVDNYVFLLGGKTNPYKYLKRANAYVLSSLAEGFPNALVEAMAVGLPVVATDCNSGPREILAPSTDYKVKCVDAKVEEYGILVPEVTEGDNFDSSIFEPCDYSLSDGMTLLLDNSLSASYKDKGMTYVRKFSYAKFKESLVDELAGIID